MQIEERIKLVTVFDTYDTEAAAVASFSSASA
jgi:hypothetical protein